MIERFGDNFALCSIKPVCVIGVAFFGSAQLSQVSWQHIRPQSPYRPRILQFSALANSVPQTMDFANVLLLENLLLSYLNVTCMRR